MTPASASATPLLALDAVVLDTETTGLDPRRDRVVQIAAVRLRGGAVAQDAAFETLIDPGTAVPERASEIHGLAAGDLAGAPEFAAVAPALTAYLGGDVIIGHNVGFDLAVLKAEHARAGLDWHAPAALDTRLLAQLASPRLYEFTLEALAEWLGVGLDGRHTAIGDTRATAAIFLALVPHLRRRNIRTLAEAQAACAELTRILEEHYKAGWETPTAGEAAELAEGALARIDAYPYRHTIGQAMSAPPLVVASSTTLAAALDAMTTHRVSSLFVCDREPPAASDCAIVTERDVLRALSAEGGEALCAPVTRYMSRPLECVFEDAYLYRAIGRMARLGVRHLGVSDETGRLVGALSQRDLLRLRAGDAVSLGDEIDTADSEAALCAAWAKVPNVARGLREEDVPGREIAGIVSRELCAMTRRAATLAEARMAAAGDGAPPVAYALAVLGSGGRGESLLAADQDNAIIHADVPAGEAERTDVWFAALGRHIADILDAAGIAYCKGGVMAANAAWRGSVTEWKGRIDDWMTRQRPEDLLNVDIFFDLRAVHGDAAMVREVWRHAYAQGRGGAGFLKLLAETAARFTPPVGLFGGLRTENGRVDLKRGGLFPVVAGARVLSIRHHVLERATRARLDGVRALGVGAEDDLARLGEAHALMTDIVLAQQLADMARGVAPSNRVEATSLDRATGERLRRALKDLGNLGETVRALLF